MDNTTAEHGCKIPFYIDQIFQTKTFHAHEFANSSNMAKVSHLSLVALQKSLSSFLNNMSIELNIVDLLVNMNANTNSKIDDRQFNCDSHHCYNALLKAEEAGSQY